MLKKNALYGLLIALTLVATSAVAKELTILTEEDPPYSFTGKDGKPTGFGVDIVTEIQRRIKGKEYRVEIYPWSRAYKTILENPNVVVFSMSRTKEREDLFQWVGPIVENDWVLIGKKGSGIKIADLEEAKKLASIGTVRDYAWTSYLRNQGFKNLQEVTVRKVNVLKLNLDRLQAFVSADSSYASEIEQNGLNPDDYEILLRFSTVQMYIAHSKATDKKVVERWQSALNDMKKDGTFAKILRKWLLHNKAPGDAKPPSV